MVRIQRVRLANDVPISIDETYLPREIGEKIIENNLETEPIFSEPMSAEHDQSSGS